MKNKLIIGMFFLGLFILIFPHLAREFNHFMHKKEAAYFIKVTHEKSEEEITQIIDQYDKCNEAIYRNEENVHDPFTVGYRQHLFEECRQILEIQKFNFDGDFFAVLEIPKLNLEIPIYLGASENELSKGIGQVEGSSLPIGGENTHTVLAGHRGMGTKEMFRHLDELANNDLFYIHTWKGTLIYEVYEIDVILPHETEKLHIVEGKDLASLITCHPYPFNSHRLVVYGERKEELNEKHVFVK